ncbi:unnamed protein product [Zymoseptoria tritici ST99CH_3D7]|uniref:Uncharacterized protein n=1 Tax=Zymoseptoria tritici (strain ST99CH_3D7) TaxID=1276538 RepID=A0A1X7RZ39_ZYMT9|nr:unnamed protein product [Zymoseptoria tritici ST99CH_3D7]
MRNKELEELDLSTMTRHNTHRRKFNPSQNRKARMRSAQPPMPPGASHMALYPAPSRATPAALIESRNRILSNTTPFIKEEPTEDGPPFAPDQRTLAIRAATPQAQTSTRGEELGSDSGSKEDHDAEADELDTAGLEHALGALIKFAPEHQLAIAGADFIAKQTVIGTAFAGPAPKLLKRTAEWVKNELRNGEVAHERRRALMEVIRHSKAALISDWLKTALEHEDKDTIQLVGTLLGSDVEHDGAQTSTVKDTKRARDRSSPEIDAEQNRVKRSRSQAPGANVQDYAMDLQIQQSEVQAEAIQDGLLMRPVDNAQLSTSTENSLFKTAASPSRHHGESSQRVSDDIPRTTSKRVRKSRRRQSSAVTVPKQQPLQTATQVAQSEHIAVPFIPCPPMPDHLHVYLPINTPQMPVTNPSVADVEQACKIAVDGPVTLIWAKKLDERFWGARFNIKESKKIRIVGLDFSIGGLSARFQDWPFKAPTAFFADFTRAAAATDDDIVHCLHAACPPKSPLPRILELPPTGKGTRRIINVHFSRPPGFMRLHVPIPIPDIREHFMALFAPLRQNLLCDCGTVHSGVVCPEGRVLSWPEESSE